LVPNFFERSELEPVIAAICELVDQLAEKLYNARKIKGKYQYNSPMTAWYLNLKAAIIILKLCPRLLSSP